MLAAAPLGIALWWLVYTHLAAFSRLLTYDLMPLAPGSHLGAAVEFFLYDTHKVMMLLVLVVFGVGVIRSYFSPERTRALLAGRSLLAGNVLAALPLAAESFLLNAVKLSPSYYEEAHANLARAKRLPLPSQGGNHTRIIIHQHHFRSAPGCGLHTQCAAACIEIQAAGTVNCRGQPVKQRFPHPVRGRPQPR